MHKLKLQTFADQPKTADTAAVVEPANTDTVFGTVGGVAVRLLGFAFSVAVWVLLFTEFGH